MAYLDRDEWGPSTLAETALYWRSRVGRGRRAGAALGPQRYREVRYEDMVEDPEGTTRVLCDFVGIDFRPEMLDYHQRGAAFIASSATPEAFSGLAKPITRGMRDWRTQMDPESRCVLRSDSRWPAHRPRVRPGNHPVHDADSGPGRRRAGCMAGKAGGRQGHPDHAAAAEAESPHPRLIAGSVSGDGRDRGRGNKDEMTGRVT